PSGGVSDADHLGASRRRRRPLGRPRLLLRLREEARGGAGEPLDQHLQLSPGLAPGEGRPLEAGLRGAQPAAAEAQGVMGFRRPRILFPLVLLILARSPAGAAKHVILKAAQGPGGSPELAALAVQLDLA